MDDVSAQLTLAEAQRYLQGERLEAFQRLCRIIARAHAERRAATLARLQILIDA